MDLLIHNAAHAAELIFTPARFAFMLLGIALGLVIGVIPGIGGLGGMALLIPFTYPMDAATAVAFLVGMWAVTATSDTVPAILFGVPGAIGSASTVLDGFPMAQRGEAGRAFGASFTASALGGVFGALLLMASIPLLRPIMLAVGTPELLAICILGLVLVASVSQGAVLKGLVAAALGVALAAIGNEAQTGQLRWTFGTLYLWDGLPIECLALGLFALPGLLDMAVARTSIAGQSRPGLVREQLRGVRDVARNWRLVCSSAAIGVGLGAIPGMGAAVIDWVAYGAAARMLKGAAASFGTGDVRGVIASEAANNAREGGSLIPTLAFGVPGSASMALLLGAFMAHDITPGPKLLTSQLDITFTLIWSLALANLIGAAICFLVANQLARLTTIRAGILVPCVLAICFIGAYQGSRSFGDLVVLLAVGVLGWAMRRCSWPRPPLILGFILGRLLEPDLFISTLRYGSQWLLRPGVMAILGIAVLVLARPLLGAWRGGGAQMPAAAPRPQPTMLFSAFPWAALPWAVVLAAFALAFMSTLGWKLAPRLMPQAATGAGLLFAGIGLLRAMRGGAAAAPGAGLADPLSGLNGRALYRGAAMQFLWLFGLLGAVALIGMLPALCLFMLLHMVLLGSTRFWRAAAIAGPLTAGMYGLFVMLLHLPWPVSALGDAAPALRTALGRIL